ncbi:MAG: hypothetical protein LKF88_01350 [Microbacteriaceae bacterium]|nr:hypothetical protein [Microbacteriaceae bacterium]MCI1207130.1 hypothetical protein [Microbacteriaceae bacterium]
MAEQEHRLTRREMRARERAEERRLHPDAETFPPETSARPDRAGVFPEPEREESREPLLSAPLLADEAPAGPADSTSREPYGEHPVAHTHHHHRHAGASEDLPVEAEAPASTISAASAPAQEQRESRRAGSTESVPARSSLSETSSHPQTAEIPAAVPQSESSRTETGLAEAAPTSTAPPTASVLILPQVPHADLTKPLDETGEVVLTGSITLPSITSSTGRIPFAFEKDQGSVKEDAASMIPVREEAQPIRASDMVNRYQNESVLPPSAGPRVSRSGIVLVVISGALLALAVGIAIFTIVSSR